MLRFILGFIGAVLVTALLASLGSNAFEYFRSPPEPNVEHEFHLHAKKLALQSDGPFGTFNHQQLQRGYQVYKEVCAGCHGISLVSFRDLHQLGYNEAEVKAEAAKYETIPTINPETGEPTTRKGIPADKFPSPYANETAARAANNNALPPDLSLMAKAREGGAAYIYSLLTGYANAATYRNEKGEALPAENRPGAGLHFNPYFANLNIAMPPPLTGDGQVTYAPGNPPATVDQMAKDVSAFLLWTAEPNLQGRHKGGWAVLIFMIIATVLAYMSYRTIWAEAKRKVAPKGILEPTNVEKRRRASRKAGVTP